MTFEGSGRHRAAPSRRHRAEPARRQLSLPTPSFDLPRVSGAAFRRAAITSSAVVAVAGLSLTMTVPANAAALPTAHTHSRIAPRVVAPKAQSYTVPATATETASTARDGFTATAPAVLAAKQAAAQSGAVRKSAAIAAILAAPVSSISYSAVAAASEPNTSTTGDGSTGVTVTTTGTVADVVDPATLKGASATAVGIVAAATQYVGKVPYVHDGADPKTGFDCSGLVMYVYAKYGIAVPHDVDGIAALGTPIDVKNARPGDLVVYPHQHIGIYIGDGYMVDAPNVGRDVEVQKVWGTPVYVHIDGA
ncbi:C40 family peptidase [Frondihabitans australicus]|nr:NlpC/P60 family protein [Frondihabitans australicus]